MALLAFPTLTYAQATTTKPPVLMYGIKSDGTLQVVSVDSSGNINVAATVQNGSNTNANGDAVVVAYADSTGGCTPAKLISAATTNATSVKATPGQIYLLVATNTNATDRFIKLYNKASTPTVGTDTPIQVYTLHQNQPTGFLLPVGMKFDTGIGFALTTGQADSDTGAVGAGDIVVNYCWK